MDKFVRLAVVLGALMAGGGIFYHYVIFLPGVEERKMEQQKEEATARQQQYEECVSSARANYDANWAAACKSHAQAESASLRNCLSDKMIMSNPYMGPDYCKSTYGKSDSSSDCTLPRGRSDSINKTYHEEQQKCLAEAKLGL